MSVITAGIKTNELAVAAIEDQRDNIEKRAQMSLGSISTSKEAIDRSGQRTNADSRGQKQRGMFSAYSLFTRRPNQWRLLPLCGATSTDLQPKPGDRRSLLALVAHPLRFGTLPLRFQP